MDTGEDQVLWNPLSFKRQQFEKHHKDQWEATLEGCGRWQATGHGWTLEGFAVFNTFPLCVGVVVVVLLLVVVPLTTKTTIGGRGADISQVINRTVSNFFGNPKKSFENYFASHFSAGSCLPRIPIWEAGIF